MKTMTAGASAAVEVRHTYFYVWTAWCFVAVAFLGFTPTYFVPLLRGTFQAAPIVHIHASVFFLWTLLFSLLLARKLYALSQTNLPPSFWLNVLTTMLLLLGQSVQDSASGKDVVSAFSVRMALFIAVTLYACAAVYLIDRYRQRHLPIPAAN